MATNDSLGGVAFCCHAGNKRWVTVIFLILTSNLNSYIYRAIELFKCLLSSISCLLSFQTHLERP